MSNQVAIVTTKQFSKDGSYIVSYTSDKELADVLARLAAKAQPIPHAPACTCVRCEAKQLRQSWQ